LRNELLVLRSTTALDLTWVSKILVELFLFLFLFKNVKLIIQIFVILIWFWIIKNWCNL